MDQSLFDELCCNLRILGMLSSKENKGCKLEIRNGNPVISHPTITEGARRWLNGDSREKTVKAISKIFQDSEEYSRLQLESTFLQSSSDEKVSKWQRKPRGADHDELARAAHRPRVGGERSHLDEAEHIQGMLQHRCAARRCGPQSATEYDSHREDARTDRKVV